MSISSCNKIIVDTLALEHNFQQIQRTVGPNTCVMAMVKSDGYGHGMVSSAAAFGRAGCTTFGVAELGEGVALRESGCSGEILTFVGFEHKYIDYLFSCELTPVIFSRTDLEAVSSAAEKKRKTLRLYIKFDCGMSRLGFKPDEAEKLLAWIKKQRYLNILGFITHFPASDDRGSRTTSEVFRQFCGACGTVAEKEGFTRSACNSGGTLYFSEAHGEMVRNGIALYGYYPDGGSGRASAPDGELRPAMSFASRILQINNVSAGSGISYGHTYIAERDMKLAVLPVGYSDGYMRTMSNRAEVLIRGRRAPVRGRICMNLCMADVSEIDGAAAGDEVILLGKQGNETIDADEIGGWCDTISYEILCAFGNNNERRNAERK